MVMPFFLGPTAQSAASPLRPLNAWGRQSRSCTIPGLRSGIYAPLIAHSSCCSSLQITTAYPEAIDIRMARDGLTRCATLLESGEYDVVILDELTIALHFGLLTIDAVLDALNRRHPAVEVVVTGRYAPQELIDAADLVTEMREIKHYYTQGVLSRDGIDR